VRAGRSLDDALAVARARGALPGPPGGDLVFARARARVEELAGRVAAFGGGIPLPPLAVDLAVGGLRVTGTVGGLTADGLVVCRPAAPKGRDRLLLWLDHLVVNALAPAGVPPTSRFVGEKDVILDPVGDPLAHLARLVALYWEGLHRPVPLFPETGCAWARKPGGDEPGARRTWYGSEDWPGESDDAWLALAFRGPDPLDDEFRAVSGAVFGAILAHEGDA
jgi:exodeoxyribonuclease V gamma subunit